MITSVSVFEDILVTPICPGNPERVLFFVTVQTRHSQNCACVALRRFATIFAHNLALRTTLYVSAKSCEHDLCAYVQGCLNCYSNYKIS